METNLQHEDLLLKLRAKLNVEKIKLWEQPYLLPDGGISQSLQDLATKYATELSTNEQTILNALHELQVHSLERSKANADFQETGYASFRVRATVSGEKAQILTVRMKLDVMGSELIAAVADLIKVTASRVKIIFNGKVIKPTPNIQEQGLKNGAQMMGIIMTETPEEVKQEDTMYMKMRQTRDDATLLSDCVDDLAEDNDYMKLEDQSGNAIQLPTAEKRSLLVGLALHERGRGHIQKQEYALALVLLLEADRQFSECRSSILQSVDNYAVLQVDISWCYLCLAALRGAGDAARRLAVAERALHNTYGERGERARAVQGSDANQRVLFMRLYLLQGIVAYHQNKRDEARRLLEKAETEINALRVDAEAVTALMELGWSSVAARAGLRAAGGEVQRAHHYLADRRDARRRARGLHAEQRESRLLGVCSDGAPVSQQLVEALVGMGYSRRVAAAALRRSNNHAALAVRIIQEQPDLLAGEVGESSSEETESPSSEESLVEPDTKLVAELEAMGYTAVESRAALSRSRNHVSGAVDLLVACDGCVTNAPEQGNPSTSAGAVKQKHKKHIKDKKRHERQAALARLKEVIHNEEDEYLDSSLQEEEDFLVQYKSLL